MTTAIIPFIISLIISNTVIALMVKDTKVVQSKFLQSKIGRIFMIIPPAALMVMLIWWSGFMFKEMVNYFR